MRAWHLAFGFSELFPAPFEDTHGGREKSGAQSTQIRRAGRSGHRPRDISSDGGTRLSQELSPFLPGLGLSPHRAGLSDSKAATSALTLKDEEGLTQSFGHNFLSSGSQGPVAFVRSLLRLEHVLGTFLAPGWELGSGGGKMTGSSGHGAHRHRGVCCQSSSSPSGLSPKVSSSGKPPRLSLGPHPHCVFS